MFKIRRQINLPPGASHPAVGLMDDKTVLRARDFWTAIILLIASVFFLYRTSFIPFFDSVTAGVDSAQWYDSAALVPYGIFSSLLLLSIALLITSIRDGGARVALSAIGLKLDSREIKRLFTISCILIAYIYGLVPRVDFIISSALLITALIWGYHRGLRAATYISTVLIVLPALYAVIMNFGVDRWTKPVDDDWLALICFLVLTGTMLKMELSAHAKDSLTKWVPVISVVVPLFLVLVMAFGFRQNVPNRTGLLFKQIEYHYYVNVRPLWQHK